MPRKSIHSAVLLCRLLWLAFATSILGQSQSLRFEHVSVEHGLSNFALTKIVQDQQGFLWFGTEDGLNKYDGYEFTVYKSDPADSSALPSRVVQALYVDHEGNIWVGAGNDGLRRYNPDSDKFECLQHDSRSTASLAGTTVQALVEDHQGMLWIGTASGLHRYDRASKVLKVYHHDPSDTTTLSSDGIMSLHEDESGALWVGTYAGLNRYAPAQDSFTHFYNSPVSAGNSDSKLIRCIADDREGVLWLGTNSGLYRFDPRHNRFTRCPYDPRDPHTIAPDIIFDVYADSRGTIWIGTFHIGLWRYQAASDRFIHYAYAREDPHSLSEDRISCIYEDHSGVMWLGTYRHGLNRYNRRQEEFARYPTGEDVYAVRQDHHGELWIGLANTGLLRYDVQGNRIAHYRYDPRQPSGLSTYEVLAVYEDRQNAIWIGTGHGLDRFEAGLQEFLHYLHVPSDPHVPEHYEVKAIFEDSEGDLWIGTKGSGLCRLDRAKKTFTYYRSDPADPHSICGNSVWAINQDQKGRLWVGTFDGGLGRLDKTSGTFDRFRNDPQNPSSLNNNAIYCVYADPHGNIWAGTFGSGLNRLDPGTGTVLHYTEREGLPDNFVKGILPDAQGNLWLSTDKGLSKFNPESGTCKNFTVSEGLISNQLLSGAYCQGAGGRLFFGGEGGVVAFFPDSLRANPHLPPVVLTRFNVFGKPLPLPAAFSSLQEIKLSYRQNFFSFDFVALDYVDPVKNQYAYKLEGVDPDWVYCGTRRFASYTNVDPGAYVFRVKGANSDGTWNETGAAIAIAITPPLWQMWWFRALAVMLVSTTVFALYRYRVGRLLEFERLRTRLAADLHDEIAGNLSSIAMFGQIVHEKVKTALQDNTESQLLQRMTTLAQESVTAIREIIWAIDPKTETTRDLLLRVHDLAVDACRAQNMHLRVDLPSAEQLPAKNLSPEQRKNLWLLLKEAINNAVKHSGGTELMLYASYKANQLHVSIIDNGSGLERGGSTTAFSGKGLKTMQARAEQLRGAFGMFSDQSGTTVHLTVKI